jgi:hypothetical protein
MFSHMISTKGADSKVVSRQRGAVIVDIRPQFHTMFGWVYKWARSKVVLRGIRIAEAGVRFSPGPHKEWN